jgi:hypothetical protein
MTRHYDRTGEPIEDEPVDVSSNLVPTTALGHCDDGWLGEDNDGRLIPCTECKPHLVDRKRGWR